MEAIACKFVFDDGKTAVLPLVRVKSRIPLLHRYCSGIYGVYGGAISEDALLPGDHAEILRWACKNLRRFEFRINPFDDAMINLKTGNYQTDFTTALDLRKGFNDIFRQWSKKSNRRYIKKAIENGVDVVEAKTIDLWKAYYDIYNDSIARLGEDVTNRYPWKLFETMHAGIGEKVKLWLARINGQPVAGILCFYHNHHAVSWHGAGRVEYFKKRPVQLLYYTAINHAFVNGYWYYDFSPSGGHAGVAEFKSKYGAQKLECGLNSRNDIIAPILLK
jgi:lipid II:glycine glycyltransferase (peptidoglycan interpeptide bridge formation enzyme)